MIVFVARDKAAWDKIKQTVGKPKVIPNGMTTSNDLSLLDGVDFQHQMIVTVFWGLRGFSGHGEKCWIESVTVGSEKMLADCQEIRWGGPTTAVCQVWPYHIKVIQRTDLPIQFDQTAKIVSVFGTAGSKLPIEKSKNADRSMPVKP